MANTYSPNFTVDSVFSDISAAEITGTGYTAGGATLASVSWSTTGGINKLTATNPAWATSTLTARFAVVYDSTVSNALVACLDFGADVSSVGATFTVTIPSGGILQETTP